MMTIIKSRNLWVGLLISAAFWALAPLFPRSYVFDVTNALSIAGCVGVLVMYYPSVARKTGSWLWVFKNDLSGAHYFVIGLIGFVSYIASRHLWNQVWRWLGKPDWMQDHLIVAYLIFGTSVLCLMHLLSRDMEEGKIPSENWRWVGIFTAIGVAMAGLMIAFFDPSPSLVLDTIR